MTRLGFRSRVTLVLLGLVGLVQVAVWAAVDAATTANAGEQASARLAVGAKVFRQLLEARGEQLRDSVRVIAADFGFKSAVATGDIETLRSMLVNHGGRARATRAMLLGLDGAVLASTEHVDEGVDHRPLGGLLGQAERERQLVAPVEIDGRPHQLAVLPVQAPARVGWVAMGFALDDPLLLRLRELTGLEVSLLDARASLVTASTLPETLRAALPRLVAEWRDGSAIHAFGVEQRHFLGTTVRLGQLTAVLQLDDREQQQAVAALRLQLLSILLAALLVGALGAALLARSITEPLLLLTRGAERIGQGVYAQPLALRRNDEFGTLARALDGMQTQIAAREATIAHQAFHDALTGLPNRAQAQQRLQAALQRAQRSQTLVAVLMLDLDRFKEINDTLGHPTGDQVLCHAARRIGSALQPGDLLARFGGDEFVIVLEQAVADAVPGLAQEILAALAQPLQLEGMELYLDASIGLALYPDDHQEVDGLLRRADIALYDAKQNGTGCMRYRSGRDACHLERLALVNELRRAIARGEMVLHFQPKWDLNRQRASHAEALVRWNHPERGMLGPDLFIPLAESSGRIGELTDWVLRTAIRSAAGWQRLHVPLGVAVNLSALDLMAADLPDRVQRLLDEFQLEPACLLLEITESAVMRDAAYALDVLHRLRALGVGLAIDDFGTGYSSLSHLRRLPVTELKIDKSFIIGLGGTANDDVIVRSTIELGHNMGLRVVAEGVEDDATLQRLRLLKCDQVQGYLVARPMPAVAIVTWYGAQWLPHAQREPAADG